MATPQDLKNKLVQKTTEVAKKPATVYDEIKALTPEFNKAMPGFLRKIGGAEKLARIALTEFRRIPELQNCSRESFYGALMTAAQYGLEPGPLGHCYLIPYKGVATLQLGYRGMLEFVQRSGNVDTVYAYPVYEGDEFEFKLGAYPDVLHKYTDESDPQDSKLTHVYAVAHIKGCSIPRIEVMTRKQVEAIRSRSQSARSGRSTPWDTDFAEMARKTVLKRICKTLPLSVEVQQFISVDGTARMRIAEPELTPILDVTPREIELTTDPQQVSTTRVDNFDWQQTSMIPGEEPLSPEDLANLTEE